METRDLELLVDVARLGSFSAAARLRQLDPSSVSRTIATLEEGLGVRLFQRSTRKIALTEAGEHYLQQITPLLQDLERAGSEVRAGRSEPEGTLRVSSTAAYGEACLIPVMDAFLDRYPKLSLDCYFSDDLLDLVADRIDVSIRAAHRIKGELVATRLETFRCIAVATPEYLASAPPLTSPEQLAHHQSIGVEQLGHGKHWLFRNIEGRVVQQRVRCRYTMKPLSCVRSTCLQHRGVTALPIWLVEDDIRQGRLVNCLSDWVVGLPDFDRSMWLVYPSRNYLPNKVRVFIDFMKARRGGLAIAEPLTQTQPTPGLSEG